MNVIAIEEVQIQPNLRTTSIDEEKLDIDETTLDRSLFDTLAGNDVLCQICFDSYTVDQTYQLSDCKHSFCRECIANYVRYKVLDGNVYPKCCYHLQESAVEDNEGSIETRPKFCETLITHTDICNVLDNDLTTIEKYIRFKYCKENKDARECPSCGTFHIGVTPHITPQIHCSKCNHTYCYFHANAHDFTKYPTCAEYENSIAQDVKESEELIYNLTRKCPGCGMMVIKSGGCNHMKCQCGVAFCWLCGKQIDDTLFPAHFQWWNPTGCANLQMNEAQEPSTLSRICARMFAIIELITLGPITLISTVIFSFLCCPCLCVQISHDRPPSMRTYLLQGASNCMSAWGLFWMVVVFVLPLAVAVFGSLGAVGLAICIACYPCYFAVRLYEREYPWPDWFTRRGQDCMHSWRRRRQRWLSWCCVHRSHQNNLFTVTHTPSASHSVDFNKDDSSVLNDQTDLEVGIGSSNKIVDSISHSNDESDKGNSIVFSAATPTVSAAAAIADLSVENDKQPRWGDSGPISFRFRESNQTRNSNVDCNTSNGTVLGPRLSGTLYEDLKAAELQQTTTTAAQGMMSSPSLAAEDTLLLPSQLQQLQQMPPPLPFSTNVEAIDRSIERMLRILDDLETARMSRQNSASTGGDLLLGAISLSRQTSLGSAASVGGTSISPGSSTREYSASNTNNTTNVNSGSNNTPMNERMNAPTSIAATAGGGVQQSAVAYHHSQHQHQHLVG